MLKTTHLWEHSYGSFYGFIKSIFILILTFGQGHLNPLSTVSIFQHLHPPEAQVLDPPARHPAPAGALRREGDGAAVATVALISELHFDRNSQSGQVVSSLWGMTIYWHDVKGMQLLK